MQNAIINAPPSGIAINVGSLQGMTIDGHKWKVRDVLKLYSHKGDLLYSLQPPGLPGESMQHGKPIEELKGGLGSEILEFIKTFELLFEQLAELTGVDRFSSVSKTPSGEQAVGTTQIAVAATSNTLKPFYAAYLDIKERSAYLLIWRVQGLIASNPTDKNYYYTIIGASAFMALVVAGKIPPLKLGVMVEARPTQEEKRNTIMIAQEAMKGGKNGNAALMPSEYLFLVNHINTASGMKWAIAFLNYKEQKRRELDKMESQQAIILQNQEQIKAQNAIAENERKKIKAESDAKIEQDRAKEQERRITELAKLKLQGEQKLAEIKLEAKLEPKKEPVKQN